jgi:hypothetical protein
MNEISQTIRQFILTTYLPGETAENLPDHLPLQTSGVLDSLAILGLAAFIEVRWGIELDVHDTTPERFDRISDIAVTITRKTQNAAPESVRPAAGGIA